MEHDEATEYLSSMLGKQLRIYTTDTRMFVGDFKCTDNVRPHDMMILSVRMGMTSMLSANLGKECNVILGQSFEHRLPRASALDTASASLSGSSVKMDMTSRYLGLIVIPGQHITKIEIEENRKSNQSS